MCASGRLPWVIEKGGRWSRWCSNLRIQGWVDDIFNGSGRRSASLGTIIGENVIRLQDLLNVVIIQAWQRLYTGSIADVWLIGRPGIRNIVHGANNAAVLSFELYFDSFPHYRNTHLSLCLSLPYCYRCLLPSGKKSLKNFSYLVFAVAKILWCVGLHLLQQLSLTDNVCFKATIWH